MDFFLRLLRSVPAAVIRAWRSFSSRHICNTSARYNRQSRASSLLFSVFFLSARGKNKNNRKNLQGIPPIRAFCIPTYCMFYIIVKTSSSPSGVVSPANMGIQCPVSPSSCRRVPVCPVLLDLQCYRSFSLPQSPYIYWSVYSECVNSIDTYTHDHDDDDNNKTKGNTHDSALYNIWYTAIGP